MTPPPTAVMPPTRTAASGSTPAPSALSAAADGEDRQAGGVEHPDEAGDPLDAGVEEEGHQAGDAGRRDAAASR